MVIETTGPITGIVGGPKTETITEMGIGTTIDQNYRRDDINQRYGTEIRTMEGLEKGIEIGVVQEKVPNPEVEINLIGIRVEMKI